jgi:DNA-binding NarL/FixJ family response regulator
MIATLQARPAAAHLQDALRPVDVSWTLDRGASTSRLPVPAPSAEPRSVGTARLVLVDDDSALRLALHELLVDAGYDVVGEAGDGAAGLAVICEARPDVVLLDLRMPGMGGVEVARQLRELSPNVRVIMFSAYADLGLQSILSDLGVSAYLIKGCPYRRIVAAIDAALADDRRAS